MASSQSQPGAFPGGGSDSSSRPPASSGAALLPIPERIGKYQVLDRLATGGMAEVYACIERGMAGLERRVVVKRILPHLAVYPHFVEMFLAEARYQARINHPNVVDIYELGEDGGAPYIAMEHVQGASVRQLIGATLKSREQTSLGAAVGIIAQACAGAHAAHELTGPSGEPLGLVHRDISPQNLMVTPQGNVKLLDFGIAKATLDVELDEHTRTALKGKIHYMAPEQVKQEPLDRRADIFALGIVAWELIALRRLFKRDSELEAMQAIVNGEIFDLRYERPDVPEALVVVIERALNKNRVQRFDTADQMRRALIEACESAQLRCDPDTVASFVEPLIGRLSVPAPRPEPRPPSRPPEAEEATRPAPPWSEGDGPTSASAPRLDAAPLARTSAPPRTSRARWIATVVGVFALGALAAIFGARELEPTGAPIVFAFPSTANAELVLKDVEQIERHLERTLRRPTTMIVAPSYDALVAASLKGEATLVILPPYAYVQAKKREPKLEVIAQKIVDGAAGVDGVIYVRESAAVESLADLKGKTFCFVDPLSTTGLALPKKALRRAGLDPEVDVTARFSGTHLQVLQDLVDGKCDAGATYSGAFLAGDRAGVPVAQLKQLAISGRSPSDAVCVGVHVTAAERDALASALFAFDPKRAGEPEMRVEHISGFKPASDADYDAVRDMVGGP